MASGDEPHKFQVKDTRASQGAEDEAAASSEAPEHVPPLDFNTFVLSLGTSAMLHLGEAPNPQNGETQVSLPLARQTIDLLGLLEEKTRGNLTGEEERLLAQLLSDLRLRYVARAKAAGK